MKEQLNKLLDAFKGTTKCLEGIADALRRKEPTPPGPYVPTSFPVGIKFKDPKNNSCELLIKWISDSELQIFNNTFGAKTYKTVADVDHGNAGIYCSETGFYFYLNGYDFSSASIDPSYFTYEWIDPSTLPYKYFPTEFPTGIRFTNRHTGGELLIKWISNSQLQIITNTMGDDYDQTVADVDHGNTGIYCSNAGFSFYLKGSDFSLINSFDTSYDEGFFTYEWVDPSTLPQS